MDDYQLYAVVPTLPNWQYWSSFGVLGILAFAALSGAVAYYWLVWLPDKRARMTLDLAHKQAMQDHEIRRATKTESFLAVAEECQIAGKETTHRIAAVMERLATVQEAHSAECTRAGRKVDQIAQHLEVQS
jgi:hypothetical protein